MTRNISAVTFRSVGTLTDLHVEINNGWMAMKCLCEAIEMGLHMTRSPRRSLLRIGIECGDDRMGLLQSNVLFHRILNKIVISNMDEYVLFWKMCDVYIGGTCCDDTEDGRCSSCQGKVNMRVVGMQDAIDLVNNTRNAEIIRTGRSMYIIKSRSGTSNSYKKWWNEGKWCEDKVIY